MSINTYDRVKIVRIKTYKCSGKESGGGHQVWGCWSGLSDVVEHNTVLQITMK